MHFKRKLIIVATALAVAAFAGGAYAASQDSTSNQRQAFLNDVAKRLNVSPAQLTAALDGAYVDQLNAAVKAGHLTQAQADALAQRVKNGALPPFGGPAMGAGRGFGFGFGGSGKAGGSFQIPSGSNNPLSAAASYLGLSVSDLASQLQSGKTLAQIAGAQGKSTSGLEQAMTASIKSRLDQAVTNKQLTSAQEQQILSNISSAIGNEINGKAPSGGPGFFGFHGGGPGGPGGPGGAGAPGAAGSGGAMGPAGLGQLFQGPHA